MNLSKGLSNRVSNSIRKNIDHMKFVVCMVSSFQILSCSSGYIFYHCMYGGMFVCFCLML